MKIHSSSKSSLFLIELIISILFFSIASTICVQLFVKSHILSQRTKNTNEAVVWIQNLSEIFSYLDGDFDKLKIFYENRTLNPEPDEFTFLNYYDNYFVIGFDQNWDITLDNNNIFYELYCCSSSDETFGKLSIFIFEFPYNQNIDYSTQDLFISSLNKYDLWHYETYILKYYQKG